MNPEAFEFEPHSRPGGETLARLLGAPEGGAGRVDSPRDLLEVLGAGASVAAWPGLAAARLSALSLELPQSPAALAEWLVAYRPAVVWLDLRGGRPDLPLEELAQVCEASANPPWLVLEGDDAIPSLPSARLLVDRHPRLLLCRGEEPCLVLGSLPASGTWREAGDGPLPASGSGRLLVLDIDGVLIDVGRSFHEAVARALAELAPGLAWTDAHFDQFKRLGGFNNDFRLASAAWVLAEAGRLDRIWEGDNASWSDLEPRIQAREPRAQVVVQRHYAATKALERPAVSLEDLRRVPSDLAILTGRPPEELALAEEVLGFSLPAVCDAAPHLRKPEPAGLLQLADAFHAGVVVFAGDTRDDAACLAHARALRPSVCWRFAAIGPERDRFARPGDLASETLTALLRRLETEAFWDGDPA